jgi:hypothetical protein
LVLPVLKALQGHSEAGAKFHINKILDNLDARYTTHERSIHDIAVACSDSDMGQGVIDSNEKVVHLKSQGILSSFNGIDIDQRREYGKISCQFYLARTLKTHGTNLLRPRSLIPGPSTCLLNLLPKSSLLQSDQLKTLPNF